ncbi:MAG: immunoglobulin domain-containing protein [Planctomycetes bacterium]|nr:immunoglobulin domain-containing protein [Planctomycetota bacterium]
MSHIQSRGPSSSSLARQISLGAFAGLAIASASFADGPMFRPDSATATSQFSSGYTINHAISGAGLAAGFTPQSQHAIYVSGNHWTTANSKTIGEFATFNFAQPKTVGGFYMWCHQSARGGNGHANNPFYCATRFDLVFFDSANNTLATLTNLTATPDVPVAQIYGFEAISNVSAIRFIVRATANNNVSPYTGLAEVAFTSCVSPIVAPVANAGICPGGSVQFTAAASGTPPFSYQWRFNGEPIDPLTNITATKPTLEIANVGDEVEGTYDCVVTGPCSSTITLPATLAVCLSDFDCDALVNDSDFEVFAFAYNVLDCADPSMPAGCPVDLNADNVVDDADFVLFLAAYNQLVCE